MNDAIKNEINTLKIAKDVAILAHYYVDGEVQKVQQALENMEQTVELPDDIIEKARKPLQRMLELS